MRVAVTGAGGRLGRALVAALGEAPFTGPPGPISWRRPDFDLDSLTEQTALALIARDRPEVVIHTAAWTDVDGCARDPDLAMARNGVATGALARTCASRGIDLVLISTNEVFDGRRTDGQGYRPDDETRPINPYGASKLAGELAAREAFGADGADWADGADGADGADWADRAARASTGAGSTEPQLAIVRTAWLFGPPGNDFPAKILAAAQKAAATGEPLRVVGDEWGTPTYTVDVAEAIVELIGAGRFGGAHHVVNGSFASRADWARYVIARAGLDVIVEDVPASTWQRASRPPRWGVLAATPLPSGEPLRPWPDAMADYAPSLLKQSMARR